MTPNELEDLIAWLNAPLQEEACDTTSLVLVMSPGHADALLSLSALKRFSDAFLANPLVCSARFSQSVTPHLDTAKPMWTFSLQMEVKNALGMPTAVTNHWSVHPETLLLKSWFDPDQEPALESLVMPFLMAVKQMMPGVGVGWQKNLGKGLENLTFLQNSLPLSRAVGQALPDSLWAAYKAHRLSLLPTSVAPAVKSRL